MDIQMKLAVLRQIYDIYENFAATLDTVCKKGCADCCTCNVTLTTLEGYWMVKSLPAAFLEKACRSSQPERFSPKVSTNTMADICARGGDPPEEHPHDRQDPCPLLESDICPLYEQRPFGCRCMVSKIRCRDMGYADIDPFVLTVNTVFLQFIEHVDASGCFGNLKDVLLFLRSPENRNRFRNGPVACGAAGLVPNRPLKVLMIPPEHRQRMQPLLRALSGIRAGSAG